MPELCTDQSNPQSRVRLGCVHDHSYPDIRGKRRSNVPGTLEVVCPCAGGALGFGVDSSYALSFTILSRIAGVSPRCAEGHGRDSTITFCHM